MNRHQRSTDPTAPGRRWRLAPRLAMAAAAGTVCSLGLVAVPATVASAVTTRTLYVDNVHGHQTSGCTSAGAGACTTIQEGVDAAEALTDTEVTLDVAGSATVYDEAVTIDLPPSAADTLDLHGTGSPHPTLDDGATASNITVSEANTGEITIADLTISGGHNTVGGGIDDAGDGTLVLSDDTISDNGTGDGNGGAVDIGDGCTTEGRAILDITGTTFDGNSTTDDGTAIDAGDCGGGAPVDIDDSTFDANPGTGPAVDAWSGGSVTNSTFVDNTGGAVLNEGTLDFTSDTISGNDGVGIDNDGMAVVRNTILDANGSGTNCAGSAISDYDYNVSSDGSCAFGPTSIADSTTIDLSALAANGSIGPETEAISTSSSAYHEVPLDGCTLSTDERDLARPGIGSACDAGAYELQPPPGYDLVGSDGGVFVFPSGGGFFGSLPGAGVTVDDIVGIVPTLHYRGYDLVGADGGVFVFPEHSGGFYGSLPGLHISVDDIVGIVPNATDTGYFLVGRDGGVFAFHTSYAGSLPGIGDHVDDVVGIAATADDEGYWVVEADGVVHAFGDATSYGNVPDRSSPVVSIAATPDGGGYWVAYADGTVATAGDATSYGSQTATTAPIVALVPTVDGHGYWLIGQDGNVYDHGDATDSGSLPGHDPPVHVDNIVGAVPTA